VAQGLRRAIPWDFDEEVFEQHNWSCLLKTEMSMTVRGDTLLRNLKEAE
jgi:hypothetical protein